MVHGIPALRSLPQTVRVMPKPAAPKAPAASAATSTTSTTSSTSTSSPATAETPDFRDLFTGKTYPATPVPAQPPAPTAESVFGPNPWVTNPQGTGPNGAYYYNPHYFATPQTAAQVAQMVGGTVVQENTFTPNGGSFAQQQPTLLVRLPDGRTVNPGLIASLYTHGYPQSYVDHLVACEIQNA